MDYERDFKVAKFGETIKLNCPISSRLKLLIDWSKGGEDITDYNWERYSLDKKSLLIKAATYDDTGIFICKGTNGFGSSQVRIDLFVLGKLCKTIFPRVQPIKILKSQVSIKILKSKVSIKISKVFQENF